MHRGWEVSRCLCDASKWGKNVHAMNWFPPSTPRAVTEDVGALVAAPLDLITEFEFLKPEAEKETGGASLLCQRLLCV